ncbi:hypothetical protein SDC9_129389 [bioreactor metagenome]|uniref:Uncharacterized protein n=1 Tax=bioreactor metagenome TaxID=1076179 RepID=A0A645CZQ1_9ZZZZ
MLTVGKAGIITLQAEANVNAVKESAVSLNRQRRLR